MIIEQPPVHVEIIQSVRTANVALKITYEFSTFTTTDLIENIKYDMNLTTLGNISVTNALDFTIFELTGMIYIHTCINICIHAYKHAHTHTYMHTCMYTYIHTYVHMYVCTYIHTYIQK